MARRSLHRAGDCCQASRNCGLKATSREGHRGRCYEAVVEYIVAETSPHARRVAGSVLTYSWRHRARWMAMTAQRLQRHGGSCRSDTEVCRAKIATAGLSDPHAGHRAVTRGKHCRGSVVPALPNPVLSRYLVP